MYIHTHIYIYVYICICIYIYIYIHKYVCRYTMLYYTILYSTILFYSSIWPGMLVRGVSSMQQRDADLDGLRLRRYCWLLAWFYRSERDWGHLASETVQRRKAQQFNGRFNRNPANPWPLLPLCVHPALLGRHEDILRCRQGWSHSKVFRVRTQNICWHRAYGPLGPRAVPLQPRDIPTVSNSPDTLSPFGLGSHPHVPGSLGEGGSCNLHGSCLSANEFLDR